MDQAEQKNSGVLSGYRRLKAISEGEMSNKSWRISVAARCVAC